MRNREESPKSNRNKLPATTGICRNIRNNISGNVNGNNSLNNISSNNSKKNKTDKNSKNSKSNNNISHNHNQTPYWGNLTWLWQQPVRCKQRNIEHNHRNVKKSVLPEHHMLSFRGASYGKSSIYWRQSPNSPRVHNWIPTEQSNKSIPQMTAN